MPRHVRAALSLAALVLTGAALAQPGPDPSKLPLPGAERVVVRGHGLAYRCLGAGTTTVVLVSGQGVPAVSWVQPVPPELQAEVMLRPPFGTRESVAPALARGVRVCVYDRADDLPDASPRLPRESVEDLHALLATLSPDARVVLVGHSLGGLIAYDHARAHPERVAGLVLVDATHPDAGNRPGWLLPTPSAEQYARAVARHPKHLDTRADTTRGANAVPAGTLGNLPLVVLTRTRGLESEDARAFGVNAGPATLARWRRDLWTMAAEYASASSVGRLVTASESGHFVVFDQPDLVVAAVREVLEAVRSSRR
ncbi:alpha/beta fold hydrolase [Deinococcus pimensis]|uniref:alpha/beta fold hydrolase n=1 Tax=Deinococcus pimensis TaxID=309888 RepID=UPI0004874492|nr:alpha/beta hydrolase [Deinococcus pimensis]